MHKIILPWPNLFIILNIFSDFLSSSGHGIEEIKIFSKVVHCKLRSNLSGLLKKWTIF